MDVARERHEVISHLRNVTSHNIGILQSFHLQSQNLTMNIYIRSKRLSPLKSIYSVTSQNTAVWTFCY